MTCSDYILQYLDTIELFYSDRIVGNGLILHCGYAYNEMHSVDIRKLHFTKTRAYLQPETVISQNGSGPCTTAPSFLLL
jgi:hypothetical protein